MEYFPFNTNKSPNRCTDNEIQRYFIASLPSSIFSWNNMYNVQQMLTPLYHSMIITWFNISKFNIHCRAKERVINLQWMHKYLNEEYTEILEDHYYQLKKIFEIIPSLVTHITWLSTSCLLWLLHSTACIIDFIFMRMPVLHSLATVSTHNLLFQTLPH